MENFEPAQVKIEAPAPDFGYDQLKAEATISLPDETVRKLINAEVNEISDSLAMFTGTDEETGEIISFQVLEDNKKLEVISITIGDQEVFSVIKH